MLPFLAYPKRYTQSALAQDNLTFIGEKMRLGRGWQRALFLATFYLPIPILTLFAVPVNRFLVIAAIYFPLMLPHWITSLQTTALASAVIGQQREPKVWANLIQEGHTAYEIVLGDWWAVVKTRWKAHLAAMGLRIFAVLGLVTYFFIIGESQCPPGLNGFCYGFITLESKDISYILRFLLSEFPSVTLSIFALVAFTAVDLAIASLIGILVGLICTPKQVTIIAFLGRIAGYGLLIGLLLLGGSLLPVAKQWATQRYSENSQESWEYQTSMITVPVRNFTLSIEGIQTLLAQGMDAGTLNSTQFFRGFNYYYANNISFQWATWTMLKGLTLSLIGLLIRACLFWLGIRWAIRLAIQHRATSPRLE